jgi:hypothetical protein
MLITRCHPCQKKKGFNKIELSIPLDERFMMLDCSQLFN